MANEALREQEIAKVKELLAQGLTLRELRWEKFEAISEYDIQDIIREETKAQGKKKELWGF